MKASRSFVEATGNALAMLVLMAGAVVLMVLCIGIVVAYVGAFIGGIAGVTAWVYRAIAGG